MPIQDGNYVAPEWKNGQPPAINASELLDMCSTLANALRAAMQTSENSGTTSDIYAGSTKINPTTVDSAVKTEGSWGSTLSELLQKVVFYSSGLKDFSGSNIEVTSSQFITYKGNGASNKTVTFSKVPDAYIVAGNLAFIIGRGGQKWAILTCKDVTYSESFVNEVDVTWTGASVKFTNTVNPRYCVNTNNKPYFCVGINCG